MGSRYYSVHTVTMSSGGTLTPAVNLGEAWDNVFLVVPTMTSNSQLHIQACDTASGTYRRVCHPVTNVAAPSTPDFAIGSGTTNRIVPIPDSLQYIKIESTATVNDGCEFKVIIAD